MSAEVLELKQNTPEWLEHRKKFMGSSDAPAAMGYSNYKSPSEIALDKKTPVTDQEPETEDQHRGHVLESLVGRLYEMLRDCFLDKGNSYIHDNGIMAASLDFEWTGEDRIVEAKTHNNWVACQYGDPTDESVDCTDAVTDYEYIQCQHQMAVTGAKQVDVAILFGEVQTLNLLTKIIDNGADIDSVASMAQEMDFRIIPVVRNDKFIASLTDAEIAFWNRYVVGDEVPVDLKHIQPREDLLTATEEDQELIANLKAYWIMRERGKANCAKLQIDVQNRIGENTGIDSDLGKITWKKNKDSKKTNWEAVAKRCMDSMTNEEAAEIVNEFTEDKTGSRVLRVPTAAWKKDLN